jgi:putative transposase
VFRICADVDDEVGAFWTAFLRSLKARGLTRTQLVISDAHAGLTAPSKRCCSAQLAEMSSASPAQFLARVREGNSEMVAAAVRTA